LNNIYNFNNSSECKDLNDNEEEDDESIADEDNISSIDNDVPDKPDESNNYVFDYYVDDNYNEDEVVITDTKKKGEKEKRERKRKNMVVEENDNNEKNDINIKSAAIVKDIILKNKSKKLSMQEMNELLKPLNWYYLEEIGSGKLGSI
jgi:hypothetical protein